MDTLRPRCQFVSILGCIWGSSWDLLWRHFCEFLGFGMPNWQTVYRCMFLMIQKSKWHLNPLAACARTIVKHNGFKWFHCFHLVADFVSGGMNLGVILALFGDLGDTFSDF